jgi:hypothetical protein
MRDIEDRADQLLKVLALANADEPVADKLPIAEQQQAITNLTLPGSAYALAARSKLYERGSASLSRGRRPHWPSLRRHSNAFAGKSQSRRSAEGRLVAQLRH